jgi:hypothetical protein
MRSGKTDYLIFWIADKRNQRHRQLFASARCRNMDSGRIDWLGAGKR